MDIRYYLSFVHGYEWIQSSTLVSLPEKAVSGGHDSDGSPIYVGRANWKGDQIPAKVIPKKKYASVAYGGAEHSVDNYEVLCGVGLTWVNCSNGHVPENAIEGGTQRNGEPLYIGRGLYLNSKTPGKIHQSHGCLYIGHSHVEHSLNHYEVLIAKYKWVNSTVHRHSIPSGVVSAGTDEDGSEIFVGRANHLGDQIPGKIMPSKKAAYISYDGQEIFKKEFEYIVISNNRYTTWIRSEHGEIPHNAVPGGITATGETLYIGRVHHKGALTSGKIHPSHGCLYIPFGGEEVQHKQYEILVENEN